MKRHISWMALLAALCGIFSACQQEDSPAFTGKTLTYPLIEGAYFDQATAGTLTVREKADGTVQLAIEIVGTMDGANHPVHLHHGSLLQNETVAQYLSPLQDAGNQRSVSITDLTGLDSQPITFEAFQQLDASIKIHFEETGEMRNVLLGATNIGKNYQANDASRLSQRITTCDNF